MTVQWDGWDCSNFCNQTPTPTVVPGDVRCCGSCWVSKSLHDCRTLWGVEFMHTHSSEHWYHWSATWSLPGVGAAAQSKIETTFPCWTAWFWRFKFGLPSAELVEIELEMKLQHSTKVVLSYLYMFLIDKVAKPVQPLDLPSDGCKGCNWSISAKSRWKCKLVLVLESVLPFFPHSNHMLILVCLPKLHKHYRSNHWTSEGIAHAIWGDLLSAFYMCCWANHSWPVLPLWSFPHGIQHGPQHGQEKMNSPVSGV